MGANGSRFKAEECVRLTPWSKRRSELYGRRLGRPLSAQQQALVRDLLPAISVPDGAIDLRVLFPRASDFALEVGFGGGEHLAAQAQISAQTGFIGCEPFANGVAKLLTLVEERHVSNVRIVPDDARDILRRLPTGKISRVFVLFPDPWPKLRHHKRRFIQTETLNDISRVLVPGGELRLATDHPDYARWTLVHLLNDFRFEWSANRAADWRVRPEGWVATRYEQKALNAGRACVYLRFFRA